MNQIEAPPAPTKIRQILQMPIKAAFTKKIKSSPDDKSPIIFTLDLEQQKTSLHYTTISRIETDLSFYHNQHQMSFTLQYHW